MRLVRRDPKRTVGYCDVCGYKRKLKPMVNKRVCRKCYVPIHAVGSCYPKKSLNVNGLVD